MRSFFAQISAKFFKGDVLAIAALLTISAIAIALLVLRPIEDPDFWWHLKSGEVMAQQGGLLQADPFTFTANPQPDLRAETILKSYWIWQLFAYWLYASFGLYGVVLLKLLTLFCILLFIRYSLKRTQVKPLVGASLAAVALWSLLQIYFLERPQIVSFLAAGLLVLLFMGVREGRPPSWWLLPLMAVWANAHGGYIFGVLMLLAFAAGACLEYRHDLGRLRTILVWVVAGIAASLVNPMGYKAYLVLFQFMGQDFSHFVMEYTNTLDYFIRFNREIGLFWALMIVTLVALTLCRERYLPWFSLTLLLGVLSLVYVRNVGLFTVGMFPLTTTFVDMLENRLANPYKFCLKIFLTIMAVVCLLILTFQIDKVKGSVAEISDYYPKSMAKYIEEYDVKGKIFNEYDWGGFLIWRLGPGYQFFIDNRGLDYQVFLDYKKIAGGSRTKVGDNSEYAALLKQYDVDVVVQKLFQRDGTLNPLTKLLLQPSNTEWVPVYLDQFSYIAVRNNGDNQTLVARDGLDKYRFVSKAQELAESLIITDPKDPRYQVFKSDLLAYAGKYDEARDALEQARRAGANPRVVDRIERDINYLRAASGH